jgi:hypothetical protein
LVFFVRGVGEDLDEVAVSPDTAAVLRWAGPSAGEAAGVGGGGLGLGDRFDDDVMFPVVAEVVGVAELVTWVRPEYGRNLPSRS